MKEKILEMLKNSEGYVSGQKLCSEFSVSRTAVWKAVNALRAEGYIIESSTNRGYMLKGVCDIVTADEVRKNLKTSHIGSDIYVLDTVDSTNNFAKNLGLNGAKSGIAVLAREQTGGKGRLGRVWSVPKDSGVMMSVLLRPNISPSEVAAVTPLAGIAVCKVLSALCTDDNVKIKWPNDVLIGKKKVCGILTELTAETDRVGFIVIGIGVNVDKNSFPQELSAKATALSLETDVRYKKSEIAAAILNELETVLTENEFSLKQEALEHYKNTCVNLGRNIGFVRKGEQIYAKAVDISDNGELIAEGSGGVIYRLSSGEVTVSGIY